MAFKVVTNPCGGTALAVFGINTCLYGETALAAFET